jgi:hypothetical protein
MSLAWAFIERRTARRIARKTVGNFYLTTFQYKVKMFLKPGSHEVAERTGFFDAETFQLIF